MGKLQNASGVDRIGIVGEPALFQRLLTPEAHTAATTPPSTQGGWAGVLQQLSILEPY